MLVVHGYGAMGKTLEELVECKVVARELNNSLNDLKEIPEVIIDFSSPKCLNELLAYAKVNHVPLVIGTTGFSEVELDLIKKASLEIPIVLSGNFSLGVILMNKLVKEMASVLSDFDIEVVEKHHNKKVDSPSGTAKMLVNSIKEVRDVSEVNGRVGFSPRKENEIGVHSLRGGTVVGEHTVSFYGTDEVLEIKHTALSKKIFALGALKASLFVKNLDSGLYNMDQVIWGNENGN